MKRKREVVFEKQKRPTEKQLVLISDIEYYTGIPFLGTTRDEASSYISEFIDDYKFYRGEK